eukprot:12030433-Prorocentrum_lima.AAC.1
MERAQPGWVLDAGQAKKARWRQPNFFSLQSCQDGTCCNTEGDARSGRLRGARLQIFGSSDSPSCWQLLERKPIRRWE